MQKLVELLQKYGVVIPEDKQVEIKSELSKGYKNIAEHNKVISKLETERDTWKEQAENAEATLKNFEGIDPAKINEELATYKQRAEQATKDAEEKIYQRDYTDALNVAMDKYKFTSESAKRSVFASIRNEGLKLKNGQIMGLNDYVEQLRQEDPAAFVDEHATQLETSRTKFTQPSVSDGKSGVVTKNDIMKIKDPVERQAMIARNLDVFRKD